MVVPDNKKLFAPFAYAPLGILYIAAVLERDGFDVEVWDTDRLDTTITTKVFDLLFQADHLSILNLY